MQDNETKNHSWRVSRELRPTDLLLVATVLIGVLATWQQRDARIDQLEKGQTTQAETNKQLRTEIREVSITISGDLKELRQDVRDVRDKVNRARM
jgi:hypothetical protein